jgi:hypothetical protein
MFLFWSNYALAKLEHLGEHRPLKNVAFCPVKCSYGGLGVAERLRRRTVNPFTRVEWVRLPSPPTTVRPIPLGGGASLSHNVSLYHVYDGCMKFQSVMINTFLIISRNIEVGVLVVKRNVRSLKVESIIEVKFESFANSLLAIHFKFKIYLSWLL